MGIIERFWSFFFGLGDPVVLVGVVADEHELCLAPTAHVWLDECVESSGAGGL